MAEDTIRLRQLFFPTLFIEATPYSFVHPHNLSTPFIEVTSELILKMSSKAIMQNKYYAVTGAGSGIGRATAIRCAELGAAGLALCDLSFEGLEATKKLM